MSLATVQLDADEARLRHERALLLRKWSRMSASPFAFLRGASALWAALLAREPKLLAGLPGRGHLVGDLHLENVGTFRTARGVKLHLNDFDETFEGPWAFDVARLLTSTLLARPELRVTGHEVVSLTEEVLDGYDAGVAGAAVRLPPWLAGRVREASGKSDEKQLAKRLTAEGTLARDAEKYPPASAATLKAARAAVEAWAQETGQRDVTLLDGTRRIAGTGSLGVARLLLLVRVGQTPRLLELKEVRGSSFSNASADAGALLEAWRACLPVPPLDVVACTLGRLPVLVRPLFASDDKLSADEFEPQTLRQTLRTIGQLAGEAHRRGAKTRARWTAAQRRSLLDAAAHLAGLHEQAFLVFCRETREAFGRSRSA